MIKKLNYKKSSFPYWFAHWSAFQMTALNLGCWKFRFLFHDWYKPWLRLIGFKYKNIQYIHRRFSGHHPEFGGTDYLAMIVDWECSRFTKPNKQENARETMMKEYPELFQYINPILKSLNL